MNEENRINNLEKRILSIEQKVKVIENGLSAKSKENGISTIGKKLSVKEFLATKGVSDDVKRTLAIAYFIEHVEGVSPFNADDLKKFFGLAKMPSPSNINDKVNMNINNRHIMEVNEKKDAKKAWVLTATGEKFVEDNFSNK